MDLSLRGSHINLAVRHKPKAPSIKYPLQRPRSALNHRLHCHSPFFRRPFSADLKLRFPNYIGITEEIFSEEYNRKNKKSLSTPSSNLYNILLNEPMKRSWVCPDCDHNSVSSSGNKISQIRSSQCYIFGSVEDHKNEEDTKSAFFLKKAEKKIPSAEGFNSSVKKITNTQLQINNSRKANENSKMSFDNSVGDSKRTVDHHNLWLNSKLDLPGKVSFGRGTMYETETLSDCENENEQLVASGSFFSNKKSVHFEEYGDIKSEDYNYSYSKCSTKNCSCKSTISPEPESYPLENEKPKCMCEFSCNSSDFTMLPKSKDQNQSNGNGFKSSEVGQIENDVINQYKDVVSNETSQPKNQNKNNNRIALQIDMQMKLNDTDKLNNKNRFHNDLSEKGNINGRDLKNSYKLESFKQNDLSDIKTSPNLNNFSVDNADVENASREETPSTSESSNLETRSCMQARRVSSGKKKNFSHYKRSQKLIKIRRSKSASARRDASKKNRTKIKSSRTHTCLREDSNLDEFHLDKVDTWISLHKIPVDNNQKLQDPKCIKRYSPEDYEENNTTDSGHSKSDSQDSSTYEEIVSVIREIEEDKKQEKSSGSEIDMDLKLQTILESDTAISSTTTKESSIHNDKLKDILSYLDDVESSCDKTLMETKRSLPESNGSELEYTMESEIAEDIPKVSDLLMLPNHQLARKVVALSLRSNELSHGIQLSKETISRFRLEKQKAVRIEKQNATNRIREQKKHYETIVGRHQGFIEQLLKDKASLCDKVAALTRRLDSQNQSWEHKLQTELARAKETAMASEKIRRERWVKENTKKIKELTVKGLEAEINKMNSDHQQEVQDLKRQHQQELTNALEEARLKYEQFQKATRESLCKDREMAIEKERATIRERFEKQLQEEQKALDEQKTKLLDEIALERERLQAELRQKESDFEIKLKDSLRDNEIDLIRVQAEYREKLEHQEQRHQNNINSIQKQFESDFLIWKKEFENAARLRDVEKENKLRHHYLAERDHQIDVIVSKMDAESQKSQEEFEAKLNRIKQKYESDINELENLEKSLRDKYNEARSKLLESDAHVRNLQAEIKQLKIELDHSKKMCDDFLIERNQLKENVRIEVQNEIASIKAERDAEIQKIYKRVQQAIEKKDATVDVLQKENANFRERCLKLEAVIRQQRKDYCIK